MAINDIRRSSLMLHRPPFAVNVFQSTGMNSIMINIAERSQIVRFVAAFFCMLNQVMRLESSPWIIGSGLFAGPPARRAGVSVTLQDLNAHFVLNTPIMRRCLTVLV